MNQDEFWSPPPKKKGPSPHNPPFYKDRLRERGSYPKDVIIALFEKSSDWTCPITGDDPAEHFRKYKTWWPMHRAHYPISYAELVSRGENPDDISRIVLMSPNAHSMLSHKEKIMKKFGRNPTLDDLSPKDARECEKCGVIVEELFKQYGMILKLHKHHGVGKTIINICPNCHEAEPDSNVNEGKILFPKDLLWKILWGESKRTKGCGDPTLTAKYIVNMLKPQHPKIDVGLLQNKWFGLGLHRKKFGLDYVYMPIPYYLKKYFPNPNADNFFEQV